MKSFFALTGSGLCFTLSSQEGVNTVPGAIALHLIFCFTKSEAIDFVNPISYNESNKSPTIAAILSLIPGFGRIYSGRFYDGLYSIFNLAIAWETSSIAMKNQRKILGPFFLGSFTILYAAEIYGSWRATKYYQPPNNKTIK